MSMPVEGFYCCFCSCFPWEEEEKKKVWKILDFNRDFCFRSETGVTLLLRNLPLFVSASLIWTLLIFNKHIYSNIRNTMCHLISWSIGHQVLPGMPASMLTMHSKSTCWRSSICWVSATWPWSNSPMTEIPSGKMAHLSPNLFSSSLSRHRAKYFHTYSSHIFLEEFPM